jgi:predicted anti-sigma-YlaC factor YlaD
MKTCADYCNYLSDYLDGEIGEEECRYLEEHLKLCQPCSNVYESLRTTVELCGKGVSGDIPEDVRAKLKMFLREHCGKEQF